MKLYRVLFWDSGKVRGCRPHDRPYGCWPGDVPGIVAHGETGINAYGVRYAYLNAESEEDATGKGMRWWREKFGPKPTREEQINDTLQVVAMISLGLIGMCFAPVGWAIRKVLCVKETR